MSAATNNPALPITEDDDFIADAVAQAHIPALLNALVHITGETSILEGDIRPTANLFGDGEGDLSEEQRARVRTMAVDALKAYRDGGCKLPTEPSRKTLGAMIDFMIGSKVPADYVPLLEEELGLTGDDSRNVQFKNTDPDFNVLIVGAGMSGILAAIRLKEAGIAFTVVEQDSEIGGTWYKNTYPGCRVDNPNHLYSYSFEPNHDWPLHFSTHDVLFDYFNRCADKYGIREHIRFNTTMDTATYDEASGLWEILVREEDGAQETLQANAFISAVGQLNRPKMPDIKGIDSFGGTSFHSAKWNHDVDLSGKRVAVIGTGASAAQFVPEIADQPSEMVIFQRTPPWISETPNYHDPVSDQIKWLLKHVPYYDKWYRFWLFWMTSEGLLPMVTVDPTWNAENGSVSAANNEIMKMTSDYIASQVGDDPKLLELTVPKYPMGGKRNLRDNVAVTTDPIVEINKTGIATESGGDYQFDVIIYATGFKASQFLAPMNIIGKGGVDMRRQWGDDARAYLGITVPGFPNFFCLYGPNTNIVVNGSIIFFSECEMRYIMGCLKLLIDEGHTSMECRRDIHDEFNVSVDAANAGMAWGVQGFDSWYKNESGRVTQNWPWTLIDYWTRSKEPDPADFEFN